MSLSQLSLQTEVHSLLLELNICERIMEKKASGHMGFKNEIARLRRETEQLQRKAADLEMKWNRNRVFPEREFHGFGQALQILRNNILFLKSRMDIYQQWYHKDSPQSDRNYSSSESVSFSPRQTRNERGAGSYSAGRLQAPLPWRSQQNRYSRAPSQMSGHFCGSCGSSTTSSSQSSHDGLCTYCRYTPRTQQSGTPAHYSYPARPGM